MPEFDIIEKDTKRFVEVEYSENCILLVDPYLVEMDDILAGSSVVRMRRPAWGKDCLQTAVRVIELRPNSIDYSIDLC